MCGNVFCKVQLKNMMPYVRTSGLPQQLNVINCDVPDNDPNYSHITFN